MVVGIADMKMGAVAGTLVTYALGSCIGICLYDAAVKMAAMIHIMLPTNVDPRGQAPMKYADTGIRETLRQMECKGARRSRITAKIAGGAKMFEMTTGGGLGNIGERNAVIVRMVLRQEGIRLLDEDVGGTIARTLFFDVATGQCVIKSYGRAEKFI